MTQRTVWSRSGAMCWATAALLTTACGSDGAKVEPDAGAGTQEPAPGARSDSGVDSGQRADASDQIDAGPDPRHCSGGTLYSDPFVSPQIGKVCYGPEKHNLPNASDVIPIAELALPTPMVKGQPYTLSIEAGASAREGIEIWGTDTECGDAKELLWYAEVKAATVLCAQIIPPANYARVLLVQRPLAGPVDSSGIGDIGICADSGQCPHGVDGVATDGTRVLTPPIGAYEGGVSPSSWGTEWQLEGAATVLAMHDDIEIDEQIPITKGYFRLPTTDPYGDAWYCMGDGSKVTRHEDYIYDLDLKNITRLGTCKGATGTSTVSGTIVTGQTKIDSNVSAWASSTLSGGSHCEGLECRLGLTYDSNKFVRLSRLQLFTATDFSSGLANAKPVNVLRAGWIDVPVADGEAITLSCSESGSITYDQGLTTTFSLDHVSAPMACPGTPIENNALQLTIYL